MDLLEHKVYEVESASLGECVGSRDKNNKPIFEGNRIGFNVLGGVKEHTGIVFWDAGAFYIRECTPSGEESVCKFGYAIPESIEVIGNSYDDNTPAKDSEATKTGFSLPEAKTDFFMFNITGGKDMYTYRMTPISKQDKIVGNQRLHDVIHLAAKNIVNTVENDFKADADKLQKWSRSIGAGAVYIVLDSCGQEWVLGCPTFDYYMLIQSEFAVELSEHFKPVADISLDSFDHQRQLVVNDATSDFSRAINDWLVPNECIIILRYELMAAHGSNELPHFGVDIFLCKPNKAAL